MAAYSSPHFFRDLDTDSRHWTSFEERSELSTTALNCTKDILLHYPLDFPVYRILAGAFKMNQNRGTARWTSRKGPTS